jgi:hypothetical protein
MLRCGANFDDCASMGVSGYCGGNMDTLAGELVEMLKAAGLTEREIRAYLRWLHKATQEIAPRCV